MDTKALRQKILDLAIRGKLVPQDPNDEPAVVLLERIRAEKQQMVKDGKLKPKDIKNDTVIFKGDDNLHYEKFSDGSVKCIEDEIPFEVPEGWAWCRVQTIASVKGGKRVPKGYAVTDEKTNHIYIRVTDMKNSTIMLDDLKYISDEVYSQILNYVISKDDIYVTIAGTIGNVGEVPDELDGMNLTENAAKVCNISIDKSFLCKVLSSEFVQKQFRFQTHQVTMAKLALERILDTLIPIAPIDEQTKISRIIDDLSAKIYEIQNSNNNLQALISATKFKILDLAIRGKLVPQDPNDEPSSVLLERIRAEKEELIKQGKIKRDKKESVIFKGDDNSYYRLTADNKSNIIDIPFDISDNWVWCNLSMIGSTNIGLTYKPTDIVTNGTMVLRSSNIINGKIDLTDLVRVNSTIRENQYIQENDILICARNGSKALVGKCAIYENANEKASFGAFMAVYRSRFFRYVYYFLNSEFFRNTFSNDDSKQINQLTQDMIKNTTIPLPPFTEQKRIVDAIETAFLQLDEIANDIS